MEIYCDECEIEIKNSFLSNKPDVMRFKNKNLCRKCGLRYREQNISRNNKR